MFLVKFHDKINDAETKYIWIRVCLSPSKKTQLLLLT